MAKAMAMEMGMGITVPSATMSCRRVSSRRGWRRSAETISPDPDSHPGGPRDGWEHQYKKKHWEFNYTNDVSLTLPEPLIVSEADPTKWQETYVYGAGQERLSVTYLPAYDANNGWEPYPGAGGAEPGVAPKTLYYMYDALGSAIGMMGQDGRVSARYHYDEFGIPMDAKKLDVNWPGPDNLFGYTGLGYDYYSDLTYARARYYKPEIGRFVSADAYKGNLWEPQSQNGYAYVHNNPIIYTDPDGHKIKGFDFSYAYFTLRYGFELGTIVDYWWDGDISDIEFLNTVGISFTPWDEIDLSKGSGYFDDSAEELKYEDEKDVAKNLSKMGKTVKTIKREGNKTPDFLVDGVKVELKTAYPEDKELNVRTSTQAVAKGINEQGAEEVILDLRYGVDEDLSALHIFDLYYFSVTKLKKYDTVFKLHVWDDNGIYSGQIRRNSSTSDSIDA